jgi:peptidoglycan-associated lipoprotein
MHGRARSIALVLSAVALLLLLTGCPKRPGITVASAPPPAAPAPAPTPVPAAPAPAPLAATPAPAPPAPAPAEEYKINDALKPVYFAFDSFAIRPADARTLDASVAWLKANPGQLTLIEGHCDERGTNEYNLALGERRAKAAMSYLVSKGVEAGRITMISYGKERPVCAEHNEACWSKNRRDMFLTKKQ